MKTLLRHAPTGLYVQSADVWTGNSEKAFDFKSMGQAIRFAEQAGFTKMELAFVSDHPDGIMAVPLATVRPSPSVRNGCEQPI